jgi:glycerol-1-phosphate dehydrogenase [NAD(P)+]
LLNGIAMEICGSSRPASGSEHLISHALDSISKRPRLHGLQVGLATYIVSRVQKNQTERIANLFDETGFWDQIKSDPFSLSEWKAALQLAPSIKNDFYTILSQEGALAKAETILENDPRLAGCFTG